MFSHLDRYRLSPFTGCAYDCAFCDFPGRIRLRPVDKLLQAARIAMTDDASSTSRSYIGRITIAQRRSGLWRNTMRACIRTRAGDGTRRHDGGNPDRPGASSPPSTHPANLSPTPPDSTPRHTPRHGKDSVRALRRPSRRRGTQHRRAVLSIEMSTHELTNRLVANAASVDGTKFRNGSFDTNDWPKSPGPSNGSVARSSPFTTPHNSPSCSSAAEPRRALASQNSSDSSSLTTCN